MKTNLFCKEKLAGGERDNTLDIVAGILIIRMILGHYLTMAHLSESILFKFMNILFFFMPWFFFKSGMFCSAEKKDLKLFLTSNLKKYVVPFLFFSFVGLSMALVFAIIDNDSITSFVIKVCKDVLFRQAIWFNAPLWFLLSLFLARVMFNLVREYVNHYILMVVLLLFAFVHHIFLAKHGIYWGGNICSGLLFYILGFKLKEIQYKKNVLFAAIVILIIIAFARPSIVTMYGNTLVYDGGIYLLWYPFCLVGIVVFNNLIKCVGVFLEHFHFDDFGRNSMIYYVLHWPLALLICTIYNKCVDSPNNYELMLYLCLACFGLLPLLTWIFNTKVMSKFIGRE